MLVTSFNNYLATSKGAQPKRLINGIYHKKDYYGGEAMTEFLISSFALACGLPYVEYKMSSSNTCVSMDFLTKTGGSFLLFYNLFKSDLEFQKWYATKLRGKSPDQRLDEINKVYITQFGVNAFGYLKSMLVIDTMFRNTDRHFKNFGIVAVGAGFITPPVFDNGFALGVGLLDDPKVKPSSILSARSKLVRMQPFGGICLKIGKF